MGWNQLDIHEPSIWEKRLSDTGLELKGGKAKRKGSASSFPAALVSTGQIRCISVKLVEVGQGNWMTFGVAKALDKHDNEGLGSRRDSIGIKCFISNGRDDEPNGTFLYIRGKLQEGKVYRQLEKVHAHLFQSYPGGPQLLVFETCLGRYSELCSGREATSVHLDKQQAHC